MQREYGVSKDADVYGWPLELFDCGLNLFYFVFKFILLGVELRVSVDVVTEDWVSFKSINYLLFSILQVVKCLYSFSFTYLACP